MKRPIFLFPYLLLIIFFFTATPTLAKEQKVFSLQECLKMAQSRNPLILASMEKRNQAEWTKKSAYDNLLPKLNMEYGYTYLDSVININANFVGVDEVSVTVHNNYALGLYIDQPLFSGFRLIESYNLADLGLKTAIAGEELAKLEITYQTVAAYYTMLQAIKFQDVMKSTVIQLQSHYDDSNQFYTNEIIPLNNLLESGVILANAKQDLRLATSQTKKARTGLATLIKEPLSLDFTIIDSPYLAPLNFNLDTLLQKALTTRPELKQANYGVESSQRLITIARSSYFPNILVRAGHNRYGGDILVNGDGLSDLQIPEENSIGVYAKWELFAWGQTNHKVHQAAAAKREAQHHLTQVMDEIQREVTDNLTNVQVSFENIATSKKAVEQAQENLRISVVRYKNQISSSTDVLDAQTLLTRTQTKLYQAIYNYNIWLASLARSVGVNNLTHLQTDQEEAH